MITNQNLFEHNWLCRYRSRKVLDVANFLSESVFEIRKTEARFLPNLDNGYLTHSTVFHFLGFDSEGCDRPADLVIFRFCSYIQCPIINSSSNRPISWILKLHTINISEGNIKVHGRNNNIWINLQFAFRYDPYVRWWDMILCPHQSTKQISSSPGMRLAASTIDLDQSLKPRKFKWGFHGRSEIDFSLVQRPVLRVSSYLVVGR